MKDHEKIVTEKLGNKKKISMTHSRWVIFVVFGILLCEDSNKISHVSFHFQNLWKDAFYTA